MKVLSRLIFAFVIVLVFDGVSKIWAEQTFERYEPVPVIGEYFRLTLGYNTGVAFGLFANGGSWPLVVTGVVILGLMFWLINAFRSGEIPAKGAWPIGFLLGGAIANFADRIPDGRVTDFLDVGLGAARWPTFNLADSFIVVSLGALMLMTMDSDKGEKVEKPGESDGAMSGSDSA
jgi:signal peptidase II